MNAPMELPFAAMTDCRRPVRRCEDVQDLVEIFDEGVQMAIYPRMPPPALEAWLDHAAGIGRLGQGFRTRCAVGDRPQARYLPDAPGVEALAEDIGVLAEIYGELLGCEHVGVRLEVLTQAMCPKFHIDRVGIRMLCTYRGLGTEWIDDSPGDHVLIERAPPCAILLLKGSLWQGNEGRGQLHRSPDVVGVAMPRVLVAIDALWD